jgi:hypothetical protein
MVEVRDRDSVSVGSCSGKMDLEGLGGEFLGKGSGEREYGGPCGVSPLNDRLPSEDPPELVFDILDGPFPSAENLDKELSDGYVESDADCTIRKVGPFSKYDTDMSVKLAQSNDLDPEPEQPDSSMNLSGSKTGFIEPKPLETPPQIFAAKKISSRSKRSANPTSNSIQETSAKFDDSQTSLPSKELPNNQHLAPSTNFISDFSRPFIKKRVFCQKQKYSEMSDSIQASMSKIKDQINTIKNS